MRCAVIGSGAAALGVLDSLVALTPRPEITLIEVGKPATAPDRAEDAAQDIDEIYKRLYRELFARSPRKLPPPKTHFGELIPKYAVAGGGTLYRSEAFGGLTKYWGGTLLPFTEAEMDSWPFGPQRLDPFYARIAKRVGVSGGVDPLLQYFGRDFATRPAVKPLDAFLHLSNTINEHGSDQTQGSRIIAGLNRCAIETRVESFHKCVYCGECMAGCAMGSIFSTAVSIGRMLEDKQIKELVTGRVTRLDLSRRMIEIATEHGSEQLLGFDKVFLCAGTIGSAEILMRSIGLISGPVVTDNSVYVFPIINLGRGTRMATTGYLGLTNLILACVPPQGARYAQVQIYPNLDYLWRYNTPPFLWPVLAPLVRASRNRIFWGRLYLHSDHSQRYALGLEKDRLRIEEERPPEATGEVKRLMNAIRQAVGKGYFVPPFPPFRQRSNSHYGGTFPFGNTLLDVPSSGEVGSGIYLCDAATFPDIPAVSLTFSIMANAGRIAWEAMQS